MDVGETSSAHLASASASAATPGLTGPFPQHRESIRKKSIQSPSSWKEALKQGCLERARRRRRDAVLRARRSSPPRAGSDGGAASCGSVAESAAASEAARSVVEEELRASGVAVTPAPAAAALCFSPTPSRFEAAGPGPAGSASVGTSLAPAASGTAGTQDGCAGGFFTPTPKMTESRHREQIEAAQNLFLRSGGGGDSSTGIHVITEEEMYALMHEVEEALQREESLLAEEILVIEQQQHEEDRCMEEQIAEYEQWQNHSKDSSTSTPTPTNTPVSSMIETERVPCPICNAGYLVQSSANVIFCPNASKMPCDFRLDVTSEGLTLSHLKKQLCRAYEEHGITGCNGVLNFKVVEQFGVKTLTAGCEACHSSAIII